MTAERSALAQPTGPYSYPVDPTDGWQPGPPTMRGMTPSMLAGAVIPLAVYYLVRPDLSSDAIALMVAGVPASAWVAIGWFRHRTFEPIGTITLFGFIAGMLASLALGGNAFVLKVRDSVFTGGLGLTCLASLIVGPRPAMFYVGRQLSAGENPFRRELYDRLWDLPPARFVFSVITAFWAALLVGESSVRVLLAVVLPTGPFLAASPALAGAVFGGGGALTIWFSRVAIGRGTAIVEAGIADGGESWRWWTRQYLRPVHRPTAISKSTSLDRG